MFKEIFGETYYIAENIQYDCVGPNTPFYKGLDRLLSLPSPKDPSQNGKAEGTVRLRNAIIHLDDFDKLWKILLPHYQKVGKLMGKDVDKCRLTRTWSNRMYEGSAGGIHRHTDPVDFVSIFYYQIPPNSANIVFVDPNIANATFATGGLCHHLHALQTLDKFEDKDKHEIQVAPGTLLCHPPHIWHGITTHKSHIPRIVIILEISFN